MKGKNCPEESPAKQEYFSPIREDAVGISFSAIRLRTGSPTAVGYDRNLKVFSHAHNVLREIPATQPLSQASLRLCHEDLRNLIVASELYHGPCDIAAAHNQRLDLQSPGETKVFLYRLTLTGWQLRHFCGPMHKECHAIGMKVVCYTATTTDEYSGRRVGRDVN